MTKAVRVLFLRSNPIDPDPRVEKNAHSLVSNGYHVSVLGWDRTGLLPELENKSGIVYYRLPIKASYATGIYNLPTLLCWQWGSLLWLIHHRKNFDIIHACDFDTVIPALLMKLVWGKQVIYDIFDFYADHLRSTPEWIKRIISYVDKKFIGWVDGIILADDTRWNQISGGIPKRSAVIYNSPKDFNADVNRNRTDKPATAFTLVYVGLLQVERGIFEILEVLRQHPDWSLELAGFGGDEQDIRDQVSNMPNVKWHGRIPYERALALSSDADILFATYDPIIPNHRFASPNKLFEAMMLGKPIIVARHTNIDRIVERYSCGLVVDYGDVDDLDVALNTLKTDVGLRSRMGQNARRAYENVYSWSKMEEKLLILYASL